MKNIIIGLFALIFFGCVIEKDSGLAGSIAWDEQAIEYCEGLNPASYNVYNTLNTDCFLYRYAEDFENESLWYTGYSNGNNIRLKNGNYECQASSSSSFLLSCWDCDTINFGQNYQLEMYLKIEEPGDSYCALNWGGLERTDTWKNNFRFGLTGNREFLVAFRQDGGNLQYIHPPSFSSVIQTFDWNKLTIRKIDAWHYFFINEQLVHATPLIQVFGPYISLLIGQNAECLIDDISIFQLIR